MKLKSHEIYELVEQKTLSDINTEGYLLRHKKSGARIVLMENEDDNKVFSIAFRTPPQDSTGLPHILEHSVLCGSKNYPVKDPFVELVKGSLNTFLNAMTYPDKTVYPVASCNDTDFQNLVNIYLDAVFYPNIYVHDEIFRQEGWSYNLESAEDTLTYNGVVYNEMKGAFSSPESVLDRVVLNSLFPDNAYANESGGNPENIPELSYEQFLDFHRKYYHPSNSYIYLYGKMDFEEKLEWLDKAYLSEFDAIEVDSAIAFQTPFDEVREVVENYSISESEPEEDNTYLSYNKVIGTSLDRELDLAFEILDYALLSAPGAPLKKALIDAGIGKDVYGCFENVVYQPMFSVVAKNANYEQKEEFVKIIENTLRKLVKEGISAKALEAGIHYLEFRYREADFGSYPKGLMYGLQMLGSWIHDEKQPFLYFSELEVFEFAKSQIGTGYFEGLIQKYLLDNTHGVIVSICPEKGRTARMDKELEEKLAAYKASLSDAQIKELVQATKGLAAYQEAEDAPEDYAKIPILKRSDISTEIEPICNEKMDLAGVPTIYHEVETNGIGYMSLLFDLSGVSAELLPYLGMLTACLGVVDTENYDYGALSNEINLHTGGIGVELVIYPDMSHPENKEFKATFELKSKALYEKIPVAFDMIREVLTCTKLEDEKRIKELVAMTKGRMQSRFQSAGHVTAAGRAMSYSSPISKFKELTQGIDFYEVICKIVDNFDAEKEQLISNMKKLSKHIFRKDNMMISYTSARHGLEGLEQVVASFGEHLYKEATTMEPCKLFCEKRNEGFKTASKVQYVARSGNYVDAGYQYHGALQILKVILGYDYLWQNVRVKGGAYGCMSNFSKNGEGYMMSYRDPNLEKTNEIFEGVPSYLRAFTADEQEMTKYIIGTMSGLDHPMTPAGKGVRSMSLYMQNISEESLKLERKQVLEATQEDIRKMADYVEAVLNCEQICVIGSEEKIAEQKDLFGEIRSIF